ncbi:peptidoglycan DD-metalloendopeptidase family protein [Candidatus Methylospira mobilis]|uniref:Peptidoglycan DD-metalloendopeptidase family protein n=1 Tax=Candidatus Methylospira mobilis TaxID=1808979 RepID=A0A5Q0BKQ3_9GAMM|nr:peptidoglycan DD-metalloendopeptidase family protein [Candidatus Methylospira mobilis]QFY42346.1 peptidoglycan DD-metalloendopeptidase family protein [Candidatus Methylospira mobilis]WNV04562.1 peptidoglycan DD-metalloendopeptidase family protein [Candidatus Methylospira mobilis]
MLLILRATILIALMHAPAAFAGEGGLLDRVKSKISELRSLLRGAESDESPSVAQLRDIERRYGDAARLSAELKTKLDMQTETLRMLRQKKTRLGGKVLEHDRELMVQARAAYRLGKHEQLKLLLGQQDFSVYGRMLGYYAALTQARMREVQKLKDMLVKADALETAIVADTGRLEETRFQLHAQIEQLQQIKIARQEIVARLHKDPANRARAEELATSGKRLQSVLGDIKPGETAEAAPGAGWPVNGRILANYGAQRDGGRWDGVLIGAPEGSPVRAVSNGQVVYSDWLRGYGLLIIVDHGNRYMSLYAFNQTLYKKVGEQVRKGDVLALVGNSGGNESPGLYFGLRQNGRPVDPLQWCAQN